MSSGEWHTMLEVGAVPSINVRALARGMRPLLFFTAEAEQAHVVALIASADEVLHVFDNSLSKLSYVSYLGAYYLTHALETVELVLPIHGFAEAV